MRVKVGLDTSSGLATPDPFTKPFASVVLPAPRLPVNRTTALRGNSRARRSPKAMVSSSEAVRKTGTLLHRRGQISQQIGCYQALLGERVRAQLACEAMQIHCRGDGGVRLFRKLTQEAGDQSGENVACATGGHGG